MTTTVTTVGGGTLTKVKVGTKRFKLTDKEILILQLLAEHKFLTTQQLAKFIHTEDRLFQSTVRAVSRWLYRLNHDRKLIIWQPARQVGGMGHGSEPAIWHLTRVGHDVTEKLRKMETGESKKPFKLPTYTFAQHRIAINDTKLLLKHIADKYDTVSVGEVFIEEKSWRAYSNRSGAPASLRPDLYATTYRGEHKNHWFIEVDRDTEAPVRIVAKCNMYLDYLLSTRATSERDWCCNEFPAVLWIMPTVKRRNSIRRHLAENLPANTLDRLFIVITPQELPALIAEGRLGDLKEVEDA